MKSIKKQVSVGVTASLAILLGLSPVTHQAQAYNEFEEIDTSEVELTPEEEALADEMYEQYLAIEAVVENLDDEQEEIFLNALLDPEFDSSQFDGDVLIAESKKDVDTLDEMFTSLGTSVEFSEDTESVSINSNGDLVGVDADGIETMSFWGGVWDATKCTAAIAAVFVPGAQAYRAIRALGGVRETVRLLAGASTRGDWLNIGGWAAAEVLGIAGVEAYCFDG